MRLQLDKRCRVRRLATGVALCLLVLGSFAHGVYDNPLIGLAKTAAPSQYLGDSVFSTQIQFRVENMGDVRLHEVLLQDDLESTFGAGVDWFEVEAGSLQSAEFQVNSNFNGSSDPELLTTNNDLAVGQGGLIQFSVRFRVKNAEGTFFNIARTESIECVPDISTNGSNPDPDGDGLPTEREPTPITYAVPRQPLIGLAKRADVAEYLGANRFQVRLHFVIENLGNVALREVRLIDDLAQTFRDHTSEFSVVAESLGSPTLELNQNFNGVGQTDVLSSGNLLDVGDTAEVSFMVQFRADDLDGTLFNFATADSIDCIADVSTDGSDPDPDGDGDPAERVRTAIPYAVPVSRLVGLAKRATPSEYLSEREFRTELSFQVENFGNTALENLQINDDLQAVFGDAVSSFRVIENSLTSESLTINPSFDGHTDSQLLAADTSLSIGQTAQIQFVVQFSVIDDSGTFDNVAFADCDDCPLEQATDGTNPDPDGNGDPSEAVPTPISYSLPPDSGSLLGLAKAATFAEVVDGSQRETTIRFVLQNYGNTTAQEIGVQDDLNLTFNQAVPFTVVPDSLISTDLQVNDAYNGASNIDLLLPGQNLAPGAIAQLEYKVRFEVDAQTGELFNTAFAVAQNAATDTSTNGDEPDVNGDGNPAEDQPTPIPYDLELQTPTEPPVEPPSEPPPEPPAQLPVLQIKVTPNPRTTRVGRVVGYTIRVANSITDPQPNVVVTDRTPLGFQPQVDEAILVRTGPDQMFDTPDDVRADLAASGSDLVTFEAFPLKALEVVRIVFPSRVTSAARIGPHPNKSTADSVVSSIVTADAVVDVIADALFSRATVVGKVFHDRDGDGRQNADGSEEGVAAARLITAEGLRIQTDQHGRFHIADIEVNGRFGENYIVKLDASSLPLNATVLSDPRQIVRVLPGGIGKMNFAVDWTDRPGDDTCCESFEHLDYLGTMPAKKS